MIKFLLGVLLTLIVVIGLQPVSPEEQRQTQQELRAAREGTAAAKARFWRAWDNFGHFNQQVP